MRVAICVSGHARTYKQTIDDFHANLLQPNAQHVLDVFLSTWASSGTMDSHLVNHGHIIDTVAIDRDDLIRAYQPTAIDVEPDRIWPELDWCDLGGPLPRCKAQALQGMAYKIMRCDWLRQAGDYDSAWHHDLVVRTRFDLILGRPFHLDDHHDGRLHVPAMYDVAGAKISATGAWPICNDKFAIGPPQLLRQYSSLYYHLATLVEAGVPAQPEILLATHLGLSDLAVFDFDLVLKR